jgi:hypothetical protein
MQFSVYKGTGGKWGAAQFNLQDPHCYSGKEKDFTGQRAFQDGKLQEGWKVRPGCVFFEITSTVEGQKNVYDWANKIILALSVSDIGKMLLSLTTGKECKIMHDPHAKSDKAGDVKKFLTLISPKGTVEGAILSASQTSEGETRKHTVPLTGDEVINLRCLLQSAVSRALGW